MAAVISIVDDDMSVRRALLRLLQTVGYAPEAFASAREYLDSAPAGRSACLVLDIRMDGMTGFELQERLAAERSAIPIILITAHDDQATRERVRHAGVAAYLPKPFEPNALLDALRRIVGPA